MTQVAAFALALMLVASASAATNSASCNKVLSKRDYGDIRRQVETLRGKTFLKDVPVYEVSEAELRAISDRALEKELPGAKLGAYEELLQWLDVIPPSTGLKSAYADFLVDQVAGLYDSDTKEMCIPSVSGAKATAVKRAAEKKLEAIPAELGDIVLAHEFTHALEDQHWPIDDPEDRDRKKSTDRGTAHQFVVEGSATRVMIEVLPAQWGYRSPREYFLLWNMIHSDTVEWLLEYELSKAWKNSDALVAGVPETLARAEAMPYCYGYSFCSKTVRQWGLDGLDHIYDHPPVSSAQVMHPTKAWEWRDLPVEIRLPETLPGGWKQISADSVGEAGVAVMLTCQFDSSTYGLKVAKGWDGDQVALYQQPQGHRLLLWASCWNSTNAAARFAHAWERERQTSHQADVVRSNGRSWQWQSPDGREGVIRRDGRRIIILETDNREALKHPEDFTGRVSFAESPEQARREAENTALRRFNPLWSWQKDNDYVVARSFGGLLSRHDRNSVGAADRVLLGLVAESRRTSSFRKWKVGGGLLAKHESESRRGTTQTSWLPWGLLAAHSSARLPQSPDTTVARTAVLWGFGGSITEDAQGRRSLMVLPFGLLFKRTSEPGNSSTHILGTGLSRSKETIVSTTRFRLLGVPVWTTHHAPNGEQRKEGAAQSGAE